MRQKSVCFISKLNNMEHKLKTKDKHKYKHFLAGNQVKPAVTVTTAQNTVCN